MSNVSEKTLCCLPLRRGPSSPAGDRTLSEPIDVARPFRLDGKVAIVTGASSGFGARFARTLHAAGAKPVLAARRADRLEALARELPGATAAPCDVTSDRDLERLVEVTLERHGRIDLLVNNAGTTDPMPAEQESPDHFRRIIDIDLNAQYALTHLVGQVMIGQKSGNVINVASIAGLVSATPVKMASYCAAKGAVVNLTRELAVQWARKGIRVNAIAPAWFPTEMTGEMFKSDKSVAWIEANTPLGRGGREHELDGALLFLASDASSYVTGQTIVVDGGWTAR
ncbi:MAG: hypothetical protein QOD06_1484 [Candidatus Binatota bacterium]|nr:hypothetical protein [Candidatus Binatota bacterium]